MSTIYMELGLCNVVLNASSKKAGIDYLLSVRIKKVFSGSVNVLSIGSGERGIQKDINSNK